MGGVVRDIVGGGDDNSELIAQQQAELQKRQAELDKEKKKEEDERIDSLKTRMSGGSIFGGGYDQKNSNTTLG